MVGFIFRAKVKASEYYNLGNPDDEQPSICSLSEFDTAWGCSPCHDSCSDFGCGNDFPCDPCPAHVQACMGMECSCGAILDENTSECVCSEGETVDG